MRGVTSLPPFAIVAIATDHLQRRDADFVAHRNAGDGNLAPRSRRLDQPGDFAGQLDPGAFAETEAADVFVKFLVADA